MKKEYTYEVGDVVTMKKPHPCGSKEWEILRVGADFRLKCMGCGPSDHDRPQIGRKKYKRFEEKGLKESRVYGNIRTRDTIILS